MITLIVGVIPHESVSSFIDLMNLKNKKVLISSGPTWVAIDDMRVISNKSSGQIGKISADSFLKKGAKVTLLEGPVFQKTPSQINLKIFRFQFYDELHNLINSELKKKYDIVIHAAAVSDYQLKKPFYKKISSNKKSLKLDLVPTEKIIDKIKKNHPDVLLVGFKLESHVTKTSAQINTKKLFEKAKCTLVIANSIKSNTYKGFIVSSKNKILAKAKSRSEMVKNLIHILEKDL